MGVMTRLAVALVPGLMALAVAATAGAEPAPPVTPVPPAPPAATSSDDELADMVLDAIQHRGPSAVPSPLPAPPR